MPFMQMKSLSCPFCHKLLLEVRYETEHVACSPFEALKVRCPDCKAGIEGTW